MNVPEKIFFFLFIGLTALSCKKDKASKECYEFDKDKMPFITYFGALTKEYQQPCFHPDNPNEFVYVYKNHSEGTSQLVKYNIQTGVKTVLANVSSSITQPKWGRSGYIAIDADYQIQLVDETTGDITQFTQDEANIYPVWSANGDTLYWQYSPVLGVPYYFLRQALNASQPDTVLRNGDANNGLASFSEISTNNKLVSYTTINDKPVIAVSDLETPMILFTKIMDIIQPSGLCWSAEGYFIYVTIYNDGLYRVNTISGQKSKVIGLCESKRYENISCSADGKYLVAGRVDSEPQKDENGKYTGMILEKRTIYLINLETLEETKVNLE